MTWGNCMKLKSVPTDAASSAHSRTRGFAPWPWLLSPPPRDGDGLAQKPYCEATRRQNPTEPRREWCLARGEPQKLPDSRSLLLHGLGELGDRDPEKAAAWGRDVWKRGRRTLQEPCF